MINEQVVYWQWHFVFFKMLKNIALLLQVMQTLLPKIGGVMEIPHLSNSTISLTELPVGYTVASVITLGASLVMIGTIFKRCVRTQSTTVPTQRVRRVTASRTRSEKIHEWKVNDKTVRLIKKRGELRYRILDTHKTVLLEDTFKTDGRSIEDCIDHLKRCEVVLNSQGVPTFILIIHTWESSEHELKVCEGPGEKQLTWLVFDKKTKERKLVTDPRVYIDHPCQCGNLLLWELRDELSTLSLEGVEFTHFMKFWSSPENIPEGPDVLEANFRFTFEGSKKSILNDDQVGIFNWGVTLIRHNGIKNNHAILVIEGMRRKAKPFVYIADLLDENTVRIRPDFRGKLRYHGKTETWVLHRSWVQGMIDSIENDDRKGVRFSRLGSDSVVGNGAHSCITWARAKLRVVGINLISSPFDLLATRTTNYTGCGKIIDEQVVERAMPDTAWPESKLWPESKFS